MSTTVLTVGGTPVSRTGGVILNQLKLSLDSPDELAFSQFAIDMPGAYAPETAVTLTINSTLVFTGSIFSRSLSGFTRGVGNIGYRCLGLKYQAYLIPVTAADGTGQLTYNLNTTDPSYVASQSGLSVGVILSTVFNLMSTQLAAVGITGFTAGDLTALTVVPPEPVYLSGNKLWTQIDGLLQTWYGNRYASYITPAGIIRIIDTTALTAQTLTFGTDPILLESLSEDTSECYTQIILRGRDDVEAAYLSFHDGTLIDPNNSSGTNLEATWTMSDFLFPTGAYDVGSVGTLTSTQATCTSDNGAQTAAVNYWASIEAQIALVNPASLTISFTEYRTITANTAMTAGGSMVVTLDHPLVNSGYTRYQIRGTSNAASQAYRRLNIKPTYVAQHLVQQFNYAVPWSPSQGAVVETWFPVGVVCWTESTGAGSAPFQTPLSFEVVPYDGVTNGYIRCYQPWVSYFNTAQNLQAGGSSVVQATDIQVLLPYSRGTLTAQWPASGYGGTAYSRFNVQRTLYRDYPTWFDSGSLTSMTTLAEAIFNTTSNVVQEGSITYFGLYSTALNDHVAGTPISLDLAAFTGTTSFESMAAPVREVTLDMPQSGAAGWITRLRFSTRRQQYSADRLYVHPMYLQGGAYGSFGMTGAAPSTGGIVGSMPTETMFEAPPEAVWNAGEIVAGLDAARPEQAAMNRMAVEEQAGQGREMAALAQAEAAEQEGGVFARTKQATGRPDRVEDVQLNPQPPPPPQPLARPEAGEGADLDPGLT